MAQYIGVDWASRGWLTVSTDGQDWAAEMHPSMHSVWFTYRDADAILVDIPIGLPSEERRECDQEAKAMLPGARTSSVFWTPCRAAVETNTYERAKRANQDCRGDSLSSQAWGLIPRIQEVDRLLRDHEDAKETVLESHPEVCFEAFADNGSLSTKHNDAGEAERLACLEAVDDSVEGEHERLVSEHIENVPAWARRIGTSNRDDLLDAMALALTAKRGDGDFATLPDDPPVDEAGLPMQIVYAEL